jgi:hypothetical protein
MSGRGGARKRGSNREKEGDEDYALKRQKNNEAVNRFVDAISSILDCTRLQDATEEEKGGG